MSSSSHSQGISLVVLSAPAPPPSNVGNKAIYLATTHHPPPPLLIYPALVPRICLFGTSILRETITITLRPLRQRRRKINQEDPDIYMVTCSVTPPINYKTACSLQRPPLRRRISSNPFAAMCILQPHKYWLTDLEAKLLRSATRFGPNWLRM